MSKRLILFGLLSLVLLFSSIEAGSQVTPAGARSVSIGGISSGLEDSWAILNNPAGLARFEHISLATSLEQRFLMKETGQYALAGSLPAGKGCLGIASVFSGYREFVDQKIIMGYGKLFGHNFLTGVSMCYAYQKAGDFAQPYHQLSYEIGTIILLSEKTRVSFAAFNPFQLYFKNENYATLPSIFKIGFSYRYSETFLIHSEIEKSLDYAAIYKLGFEYMPGEIFALRAGISGFPATCSFGAGMHHKCFLLEFASCYHLYLGFSPIMTFQYNFK